MLADFADLLGRVESTSSKNDKVLIIREALNAKPELKRCFELALSPYITFGVAKLPPQHLTAAPRDTYPWQELLNCLAARQISGGAALNAISEVRASLAPQERLAFDRILLKDLRVGATESTVNKACPGTVPVFSCQLAPSEMPKLDELTYPVIVEPKLDGVRTIAIKREGVVKLFSRNGLEFTNFGPIVDALAGLPDNAVLDGEVVSPQGFAALMTRAKSEKHSDVPVQYVVFDALSLTDWDRQRCDIPFQFRVLSRAGGVALCESRLIREIESLPAASASDLEQIYARYVGDGYEGAMVKDPDHLYSFKRNARWQKLKPFDTADLEIVDAIEGTGKYAGMLGALVLEGEHLGKQIRTEVGSGFTDADRAELWRDHRPPGDRLRQMLVGRVAEIRYQEITKAQDSDTHSLRFPTFVRWRDDK